MRKMLRRQLSRGWGVVAVCGCGDAAEASGDKAGEQEDGDGNGELEGGGFSAEAGGVCGGGSSVKDAASPICDSQTSRGQAGYNPAMRRGEINHDIHD